MESFLSLDADEIPCEEDGTSNRGFFPISLRNRTLSGFGRKSKKSSTSYADCYHTSKSHTNLATQHEEDVAAEDTNLRSAFDESRIVIEHIHQCPAHGSLTASQESSAASSSPTTTPKTEDKVWEKWLEVSDTLTPIVSIGTKAPSSTKLSDFRQSTYLRHSWRLSRPITPATKSSGESVWPICSSITENEVDTIEVVSSSKKYHVRPQTADHITRRIGSTIENFGVDDGRVNDLSYKVDNPTTGGKVALRSLALLSRPISKDGLGQSSQFTSSVQQKEREALFNQFRQSQESFLADSDTSPLSSPPPLNTSDKDQEQMRPDSPTLPVIVAPEDSVTEKQSFGPEKKRLPRVSFVSAPLEESPIQVDAAVVRKKSSWTSKLKHAFSHKTPQPLVKI